MLASRTIDARIAELAAPTCAVVRARDLRAAGISRQVIASRLAAGLMAEILPRVYAVGPTCRNPSFEMRCMAALLSRSSRAWIDGSTAARLVVGWERGDDVVHATVAGTPPSWHSPGFSFHRRPIGWRPTRPTRIGPLETVGFEEICQRLARTATPWQLANVMDRGLYERRTGIGRLQFHCSAMRGHPGSATFDTAVRLILGRSVGTRSEAEDRVLADALASGAPVPLVNVRGSCGLPHDEPDLYWPDVRLNVEVDGRHHDAPAQQQDDAARDELVERQGIRVIRLRASWLWQPRRDTVASLVSRAIQGEQVPIDPRTRRLLT